MTRAPESAATGEPGAQRYRRSAWSSLALVGVRATSALTTFASVPLLVGHLGSEGYGLVVTAVAFVSLVAVLDCGVPAALIGAVAEAQAQQRPDSAASLVSTALALLGAVSVAGVSLLALAWFLTKSWPGSWPPDSRWLVATLALGWFVALPARVVDSTWQGLQRGYRASLWLAVSAVTTLGLLYWATSAGAGLRGVAAVLAFGPLLGTGLSALDLFVREAPLLRPRFRLAQAATARRLGGLSLPFLRLQWAGAVNNQSDSLVIAGLLGVERVAEYAVTARLFLPLHALLSAALQPLWPAYAEAAALNDREWAAKTLRRSVMVVLVLAVPACLALTAVSDALIAWWIGPAIQPAFSLRLAYAAWTSLALVSAPFAIYLTGLGAIQRQARLALAGAAVNLALSVLLVAEIGPAGALWASVLAQGAFLTLPAVLEARRRLRAGEAASAPKP